MNEATARLYDVLSATRDRLRVRGLVRGAAAGAWLGAIGALLAPVLCWSAGLSDWIALAAIVATLAAPILLGAATGALSVRLTERDLALLADRVLGTDEVFVTAHGLHPDDPTRAAVLEAVVRRTTPPPDLRRALPARLPRHARWAAVPVACALALLLVAPRAPGMADPSDPAERMRHEGEALAKRLEEIAAEHPELPRSDAGRDLEDLARDLERGKLTEQEARERLAEIEESLDRLDGQTAEARKLLDDLEQAAKVLEESPATEPLADAMKRGEPGEVAREARDLAERLSDPATAPEAAEGLKQAGEQLARSDDPAARAAGEALKNAAAQARDGMSAEEAQELAEQLEQVQGAAEQAAAQRGQAERLRGASERTASALGGGAGEGEGEGPGETKGKATAGKGHTWEDGGDHASDPAHQDDDRNTARTEGQTAEDFRELYKSVRRYEGAERVLAEADGELAKDGHIDELPVRFTAGEETAGAPRVQLPEAYREEAAQAIAGEEIPAGYRDAVKSYFEESR